MDCSRLKPGDHITVNKRGRQFPARYEGRDGRELRITPLARNINYFTASPREVIKAERRGWNPASALKNGGT